MNVIEAIMTRRTIKAFKPDPVPYDKVVAWLQAASYAPNHRMTEPWQIRFIGPETRAKVAHKKDFGGAPTLLAIISTPAKTRVDRDEHVEAVACFILNFQLAAHAEGVGTGWSSIGVSAKVREILGLEEGCDVVGFIPIGFPETVPEVKPRTPITEKISQMP